MISGASKILALGSLILLPGSSLRAADKAAPKDDYVCPTPAPKQPEMARSEVYASVPYKPGEKAVYAVSYGGVLAGMGTMEVRPPVKHNGLWQRVFHLEGKTGEWFAGVFEGNDQMEAVSRPSDFGVSKFFMDQYEKGFLKRAYISKKWIDFDQDACVARETTEKPDKPKKNAEFKLHHGAMDALSAAFWLRTRDYKLGKQERGLVYTSEQNWWLEVDPVLTEIIETKLGKREAIKLKLQTRLGKDLQQKGDVFVWIDVKSPHREILQIQGEIKVGSIWMRIESYEPGS